MTSNGLLMRGQVYFSRDLPFYAPWNNQMTRHTDQIKKRKRTCCSSKVCGNVLNTLLMLIHSLGIVFKILNSTLEYIDFNRINI